MSSIDRAAIARHAPTLDYSTKTLPRDGGNLFRPASAPALGPVGGHRAQLQREHEHNVLRAKVRPVTPFDGVQRRWPDATPTQKGSVGACIGPPPVKPRKLAIDHFMEKGSTVFQKPQPPTQAAFANHTYPAVGVIKKNTTSQSGSGIGQWTFGPGCGHRTPPRLTEPSSETRFAYLSHGYPDPNLYKVPRQRVVAMKGWFPDPHDPIKHDPHARSRSLGASPAASLNASRSSLSLIGSPAASHSTSLTASRAASQPSSRPASRTGSQPASLTASRRASLEPGGPRRARLPLNPHAPHDSSPPAVMFRPMLVAPPPGGRSPTPTRPAAQRPPSPLADAMDAPTEPRASAPSPSPRRPPVEVAGPCGAVRVPSTAAGDALSLAPTVAASAMPSAAPSLPASGKCSPAPEPLRHPPSDEIIRHAGGAMQSDMPDAPQEH
jgi:hypothetical protein